MTREGWALRCAFERSTLGLAVTRGAGHEVAAVNPAFLQALGRTAADVVGQALASIVPVGARPALDAALAGRAELLGEPLVTTEEVGGRPRTLRWAVTPCPPDGAVVQCWDATLEHDERRHAAEEARDLRAQQEQLRAAVGREQQLAADLARHAAQLDALLEGMTEGVVVVDSAGKVALVNQVAREALALSRPLATIEDLRQLDVRRPDDTSVAFDDMPIARAMRDERFAGVELAYVRPDGERRLLVFSGGAIAPPGERAPLFLVVLRDVTELRRAEAERDEALSLISHDLRAPIATIALAAELLHRGLLERGDETLARTAESLLRSVRRTGAMIDELALATSLSADEQLEVAPVDLLAVVTGAVEQSVPPDERARVRLEPGAEVPTVVGDPERLERAVANLTSNAVKYSPREAPVVVRLARQRDEVIVSVEDHGVGIPPEDLPRLFQKRFRARTAGPVDGLGLGLYIVRRIAEGHGGRVWVESEVGRGSVFHMALPLSRQRPAPDGP